MADVYNFHLEYDCEGEPPKVFITQNGPCVLEILEQPVRREGAAEDDEDTWEPGPLAHKILAFLQGAQGGETSASLSQQVSDVGGRKRECPGCGAPGSFVVDSADGSRGHCSAERATYTLRPAAWVLHSRDMPPCRNGCGRKADDLTECIHPVDALEGYCCGRCKNRDREHTMACDERAGVRYE